MQKFLIGLFLGTSLFLFSNEEVALSNFTKQRVPSQKSQSDPDACWLASGPKSRLSAGANYTWVEIDPDGAGSTSGNLGGFQARYEYRAADEIYGAMTFAWRQGTTTGGNAERTLCYIDMQERLGYTMNTIHDCFAFSLFTGLGYRHSGEKVKTTPQTSSIRFEYNELYIPVGFLLDGQVHRKVFIGLEFEWMPEVYPTVKIEPLYGARWILTHQLGNVRISAPVTVTPDKNDGWFLRFTPFFEYWRDGRTTAVSLVGVALGVPANSYYFAGLSMDFGYAF